MTRSAEFAPITALNCETIPQARTEVEMGAPEFSNSPEDTPPFSVVAHITMPKPARGMMTDLTLNKC